MKRPIGTIEQLGPKLFRLRVSAGRDPITGQRRRPIKTFTGTQRQAEAELAKMIAAVGSQLVTSADISLAAYLNGYYLPHAERLRPSTYKNYKQRIDNQIIPLIGTTALDKLTPWVLDKWLVDMTRTGVPDGTRKYAQVVLRIALRQAVRWRMLEADPTEAVDKVRTRKYQPRVLTSDQAIATLGHFAGHPLEVVVSLALGGGFRRSEICGFLWDDVDFELGSIRVDQGYHAVGGYQDTKSENSDRTVGLPTWTMSALKRQRDKQDDKTVNKKYERMAMTPVVASREGTPIHPDNITHRYASHMKKLKTVPYVPLKELRHSHATLALESGTNIVVVSRRLGHGEVSTTDRFYVRPAPSEDTAATTRFEGLIAPPATPGDEASAA
jgi:integrase